MELEEMYRGRFPGIKPGWVFDSHSNNMISRNAAISKKCPVQFESFSLSHKSLQELVYASKTPNFYVWQKEFESSKEKNCFLLWFNSSYSETLDCYISAPKGTVIKVNYKRSFSILVCSNDDNSFGPCSSYINNIIKGVDANLDEKTCESCKTCYIYDGHIFDQRNMRSFNSVMHCLKEVSRIIGEIKDYENFLICSWLFLKENSLQDLKSVTELKQNAMPATELKQDTNPPLKSSTELSFYNKKLFDTTEKNNQPFKLSQASHSFGNDSYNYQLLKLSLENDSKVVNSLRVSKSSIAVNNGFSYEKTMTNSELILTNIKDVTNSNLRRTPDIDVIGNSYLINSHKGPNIDKTIGKYAPNNNLSNLTGADKVASDTSLTNGSANKTIEDKETQHVALHNTLSPDSFKEIECKKKSTCDIKTSSCSSADDSRHSAYINSPIIKTDCITASTCSSVPNDITKDSTIKELVDNYENSDVIAKEIETYDLNDENINNGNYAKQTKRNSNKRASVADRNTLDGPSKNEPGPSNQRQLKKLKKDNYIMYLDKKISLTVAEENVIRKVEIGIKNNELKGKVIVLLGATGSGKTSIVNLCANFYYGAQNAEDEKLFIVDSKVKTDRVTVYTFHPEGESQFPLTVVDTPGLNDSTGAEIHDHVDALKSFLALACSRGLEINAICFVAQAHLVRLTSSEKLVMDYVRSLFGSEVEEHIMVFVTFSDNQPIPPVIEAMEQYGFTKPFFVKFNNTLLISKSEEVDDLDRIYWRTGIRSWKKFLQQLSLMVSLSKFAISSVKTEVFNKSVLNKYTSNLEAEVCNFISMCRKKKETKEFYSDEELLLARKKVWMASNDAYNVEVNSLVETKELFMIEACQLQLNNEKNPELATRIKIFLLLDNESNLNCVLKKLVAGLVQCLSVFNEHPKALEDSLVTFCNGCNKRCYYKKQWVDKNCKIQKFYCKCSHSNGLHGPLLHDPDPSFPPLRFVGHQELFGITANLIEKEISKYAGMNSDVSGVWTIGQVLRNLQFNESQRNAMREFMKFLHI